MLWLLLVALFCFSWADAQKCEVVNGIGFNYYCPMSAPYCTNMGIFNNTWWCRECASDCDCPINQFCSKNFVSGAIGSCLDFEQNGQSCLPLSNGQLQDPNFNTSLKCATVTPFNLTKIGPVGYVVDAPRSSICKNGECVVCSGGAACTGAEGLGEARTCNIEGKYAKLSRSYWNPPGFFTSPTSVFLVFIMLLLTIVLILVCVGVGLFCVSQRGRSYERV